MHAVEYLSRKSRGAILFIGMVLVLYVGAIDFVTGPMVAMLVFYLAPICFVAWFAGRWQGLVTALTAGLVWYAAKLMDPDSISRPYMLLWNFFMRVGVF